MHTRDGREITTAIMVPMLKMFIHCSALFFVCLSRAGSQTLTACGTQTVNYRAAPREIEKKIQPTRSVAIAVVPTSGKRVASPQGTRWFVEVDPDYMSVKEPWKTTLYIGSAGDDKTVLLATFTDHGNTFSAHWINEKLLFVQVWWGRIASSDLILDVSQGKYIYNEFANYGELVEPCRE